ncbi:MAG TPA: cobalamin-independent methionine synthase II family protein [Solirubrobacteraceae bacterium]|nr:cobalamin-independent methionine synthase II family protein [Solirubrobacteraceae bacterium]
MRRSDSRILTTHVGSLARPHELLDAIKAREEGGGEDGAIDSLAIDSLVSAAVTDVVRRQAEAGIDIVTDGEQSKLGFYQYLVSRLDGMESRPGRVALPASWQLEVDMFPDYYAEYFGKYSSSSSPTAANTIVCTGPISYKGHEAVVRDIENLKTALGEVDVEEAFMPASAPHELGSNEYYGSSEEYVLAIAEALHEEYRAIIDAGLILQVDDPFLIDLLMDEREPAQRRAIAQAHVEVVNHALRGLPVERVRLHTCYGLNHGPRLHDAPLADVVPLMLQINAGAYSFEVGNPRHAHEWRVWEDTPLPDGKIIIPGFLCHAHNFVEHPQLIADGIVTYARLVGRENVIAGADCGFSSRAVYRTEVHPTVVWAKFRALSEGARIATEQLWRT